MKKIICAILFGMLLLMPLCFSEASRETPYFAQMMLDMPIHNSDGETVCIVRNGSIVLATRQNASTTSIAINTLTGRINGSVVTEVLRPLSDSEAEAYRESAAVSEGVVLWDSNKRYPLVVLQRTALIEKMTLESEYSVVGVGQTLELRCEVLPEDAAILSFQWKSSNPKVATVENGIVTGVAPGEVTVSATALDGTNVKAIRKLRVVSKFVPIETFDIALEQPILTVGEVRPVDVTFQPEDASIQTLKWKSSKPDVASVEDGVITALSAGSATISATAQDGADLKRTIKITVVDEWIPIESFQLTAEASFMGLEETMRLTPVFVPEDAAIQTLKWKSGDSDIATVEDGVVTAHALGTVTISATAQDGTGLKATYRITVVEKWVPLESLALESGTGLVEVGRTLALIAIAEPKDASIQTYTWRTSNPDVATVENGVVTGVAPGKVTISATSQDGTQIKATCKVTVVAASSAVGPEFQLSDGIIIEK